LPEAKLVVVSGPDRGRELSLTAGTHMVGKAPTCELVLRDDAVSRRHLEVALLPDGVRIKDLGSTNGSFYKGARFESIYVGPGALITLGETVLAIRAATPAYRIPAGASHFGAVIGASEAMSKIFEVLERVAPSDVSVLLQGETGTGKELIVEALHAASSRREGPLVVCDLGVIPRALMESELFGHVRGAFTGADQAREGAFEQADGGTLLLDEIGELADEGQRLLLRALEKREIRPVGGRSYRPVDLRIVATTHRDLAAEVRAGRFREDLYHRLCVVRVVVPPLRERAGDVAILVEAFLAQAAQAAGRRPPHVPPETLAALEAHDWPGNVRELKNVLERAVSLAPEERELDALVLGLSESERSGPGGEAESDSLSFREAKFRLVAAWEYDYLTALLARADGNVSRAARDAGLDRPYLHRLLKKHGLGSGG